MERCVDTINCKYCCSEIPAKATVCPVCRKSLSEPGPLQKILNWRDVVTFPTAVAALIAAVYTPAVEPVQRWLGLDDSELSAAFLNPDIHNVEGKNEAGQTVITDNIPMMRMLLSNTGYTLMVVLHNFTCVGEKLEDGNQIFVFRFFEPGNTNAVYPSIERGASRDFFAAIDNYAVYPESEWQVAANHRCTITYTDKHGRKDYDFAFTSEARENVMDVLN